jgi:uncharacterized LabA/DUF88 family protein
MKNNNSKKRVAIYIDGSNFYFSIKNTFKCKIDIGRFCNKLIENDEIVKINYYIAPIDQESYPEGYKEQQKFFNKLKKIKKLHIIFGRLERRKTDNITYYVEKASDINLALDLVLDAQRGVYDKAFIVSNDGDFSGAVTSAINFGKEVIYVAIGNKKSISFHLKKVASSTIKISEEFISDIKL